MAESFILQILFKLTALVLGIVAARLVLLWMDTKLVPEAFKEWIDNADDFTKAVYYGLRIIGICMLVGLALS